MTKRISKILGCQVFSLNLGEVLVIVIAALILEAIWPDHPAWVPFALGWLIGTGEIAVRRIWRKRVAP